MRALFGVLKFISICLISIIFGVQITRAAPENLALDSAEEIIEMLYHDYAWEVLDSAYAKTPLEEQSIRGLEKYFDSELSKLIKEDRNCVERTQDICSLDFKVIYASQDPAAYEINISSINKNNEIRVQFKSQSNLVKKELTYKMIRSPNGWRIHDIVYENANTTLRTLLQ